MKRSPTWPERLNAVIGSQVQRHRKRRNLRQDELAAECTRLGLPISRSKIANMENGRARQEGISLAEIQVLAVALGVPPILLVFPLAEGGPIAEPLPDLDMPAWDAIRWFSGEAPIRNDDASILAWEREAVSLSLHRRHAELLAAWTQTRWSAGNTEQEREEMEKRQQLRQREVEAELASVRTSMRVHGVTLPPLNEVLQHIDKRPGQSHLSP